MFQVKKQQGPESDEEGLDQPVAVYDEEGVLRQYNTLDNTHPFKTKYSCFKCIFVEQIHVNLCKHCSPYINIS